MRAEKLYSASTVRRPSAFALLSQDRGQIIEDIRNILVIRTQCLLQNG